jgi:hypothetical protein
LGEADAVLISVSEHPARQFPEGFETGVLDGFPVRVSTWQEVLDRVGQLVMQVIVIGD